MSISSFRSAAMVKEKKKPGRPPKNPPKDEIQHNVIADG